ncbi:MAG: hypothetical protein KGS61_15100 [Verrucomicrobia bacterium]|nr:hypothetical protein [Verrucomicrobiota bacterium]
MSSSALFAGLSGDVQLQVLLGDPHFVLPEVDPKSVSVLGNYRVRCALVGRLDEDEDDGRRFAALRSSLADGLEGLQIREAAHGFPQAGVEVNQAVGDGLRRYLGAGAVGPADQKRVQGAFFPSG